MIAVGAAAASHAPSTSRLTSTSSVTASITRSASATASAIESAARDRRGELRALDGSGRPPRARSSARPDAPARRGRARASVGERHVEPRHDEALARSRRPCARPDDRCAPIDRGAARGRRPRAPSAPLRRPGTAHHAWTNALSNHAHYPHLDDSDCLTNGQHINRPFVCGLPVARGAAGLSRASRRSPGTRHPRPTARLAGGSGAISVRWRSRSGPSFHWRWGTPAGSTTSVCGPAV